MISCNRPGARRRGAGSVPAASVARVRAQGRAAPLGASLLIVVALACGSEPAPRGADSEAREGEELAFSPADPSAGAVVAQPRASAAAAEGRPSDSRQRGQRPLPELTPPIGVHDEQLRLLESSYPVDRQTAVATLIPYGEQLDLLITTLANDTEPEVRAAAADRLRGAGKHAATSALLGALQDEDPRVVVTAIDVLQMTGDPSTLPALAQLLMHPSDEVRNSALDAMELLEPLE